MEFSNKYEFDGEIDEIWDKSPIDMEFRFAGDFKKKLLSNIYKLQFINAYKKILLYFNVSTFYNSAIF